MTPNNQDFAHVLSELQHKIQTDTQHLRETEENLHKATIEKTRLHDLIKTKEAEIERAKAEISAAKSKLSQVEREETKLSADVRRLKDDEMKNKRQLDEVNRQVQEASRATSKK